MKTECSHCHKEIERKPNDLIRYKNVYCSAECRNYAATTASTVACTECGKALKRTPSEQRKSKSGNFFCDKSCSASYNNKAECRVRENHPNWKGGSFSYREYKLNSSNKVCNRCGYDNIIEILQVHHIDHDRTNNSLDNLEVLCPNCHCEEHIVKYGGNHNKPVKEDCKTQ